MARVPRPRQGEARIPRGVFPPWLGWRSRGPLAAVCQWLMRCVPLLSAPGRALCEVTTTSVCSGPLAQASVRPLMTVHAEFSRQTKWSAKPRSLWPSKNLLPVLACTSLQG